MKPGDLRTKVILVGIIAVVLGLSGLLVAAAFTGAIDEPLAAALTASATLLLVGITAWYATATARLSQQTRAQTEVMLASQNPKLVADFEIGTSGIQFDLHNAGRGPAVDIEIIIELSNDSAVHEHRTKLSRSIRPGQTERDIQIHPSFRGEAVPEYVPVGTGSYPGATPGTYEHLPLTPFLFQEWGHRNPVVRFRIEYSDVIGNPAEPITVFEGTIDKETLGEDWSNAFKRRIIEESEDGILTRLIDRLRDDTMEYSVIEERLGIDGDEV